MVRLLKRALHRVNARGGGAFTWLVTDCYNVGHAARGKAAMAIPDYQTLMLPVLKCAAEGETRVPDLAERIANELGLSQDQREEMLPSGRQRLLHNRIHWAKFYMSKAGLIASPARGGASSRLKEARCCWPPNRTRSMSQC